MVECSLHIRGGGGGVTGSNPDRVSRVLSGLEYLTQSPLVIGILSITLSEEWSAFDSNNATSRSIINYSLQSDFTFNSSLFKLGVLNKINK